MMRDLTGDLVPGCPVVAQPSLEDDGRGATSAGRRDLYLVSPTPSPTEGGSRLPARILAP